MGAYTATLENDMRDMRLYINNLKISSRHVSSCYCEKIIELRYESHVM